MSDSETERQASTTFGSKRNVSNEILQNFKQTNLATIEILETLLLTITIIVPGPRP